jgi:long-chain acyl-CoA synthetase
MVTMTFNHPGDEGFDPMAVGRALPGVEIRVLAAEDPRLERGLPAGAEGQVAVKSPAMFIGYLGGELAEIVDGFFLTGDLGRLDSYGALTLTGRTNLLIDVGGLKVNPLEVEAALTEHPAVRECVVIPVPVSQTLRRLKAVLTLKSGATAPTDEQLRAWARRRLTPHKIPRHFEVRAQLPKNGAGKTQRQVLLAGG